MKITDALKQELLLCAVQSQKLVGEIKKILEEIEKADKDYILNSSRSDLKSRILQVRKDLLELRKSLYK